MTRLKAPLLSLGAHGTLGDVLTLRRHNKTTIAETKPIPTDLRSPAQLYQRRLYRDALLYWSTLTEAEKQAYKAAARASNNTLLGQFLSAYLVNQVDIISSWPFDEFTGTLAHDLSQYRSNATLVGPTWQLSPDGKLHLYYDGVNDYSIVLDAAPQIGFTTQEFSIILLFRTVADGVEQHIFCKGALVTDGWALILDGSRQFGFRTYQAAALQQSFTAFGGAAINTTYTLGITRIGASIRVYLDGVDATVVAQNHIDPDPSARTPKIGINDNLVTQPVKGWISPIKVFSEGLTPAQQLAWHNALNP